MAVHDLTHFITETMPVYPGTERPTIVAGCTIEKDGFAEKRVTMFTHTGTHMDAPGHILPGAPTLDMLDIGTFIGNAYIVDISRFAGGEVEIADISAHEQRLREAGFALFHTGYASLWGEDRYFRGFPVFSAACAAWIGGLGLKGVGLDAISVDPVDSADFPRHRIFFGRGMVIVENLAGLGRFVGRTVGFACFPLKLADADGSPVRAVAIDPAPGLMK